jgi:DNA-binding NarL/FixJ family response regulator
MIRVLIVDDHPFVRSQIRRAMSEAEGIVVVGECTDGDEVPSMAALLQPDVVLMDVRMPRTSGTLATVQLLAEQPSSRVMMLTGSPTPRTMAEALQAGAVGFLTKDCGTQTLVSAVRTVAAGGTAWPPE